MFELFSPEMRYFRANARVTYDDNDKKHKDVEIDSIDKSSHIFKGEAHGPHRSPEKPVQINEYI